MRVTDRGATQRRTPARSPSNPATNTTAHAATNNALKAGPLSHRSKQVKRRFRLLQRHFAHGFDL